MGYEWPAVSGMDYWQYQGVKLAEIGTEDLADDPDAQANLPRGEAGPLPASNQLSSYKTESDPT
jgi:hypothetical protein